MPYERKIVTNEIKSADRLPDYAVDFALIVEMLRENNILEEFCKSFQVERKAGSYQGIDAWLLLTLTFTASNSGGINGISKKTEKYTEKLGALAGRRRIMTQQSFSRFTKAIKHRHMTEDFAYWLLVRASRALEVMNNSFCSVYDTEGKEWRFYDFDGTLVTVRQRALPTFEDMPAPERLKEELVAPGHSGKKRGELQMCRETLQDAGSGVWLACYCSPGNGDKENVAKAAKLIASTMRDMGKDSDRAILRLDGYYRSWKVILACQQEKIFAITRWFSDVLHWLKVHKTLKKSKWQPVIDSGSGPQRYAAEGGIIKDPNKSGAWGRLVVSRYWDDSGKGAGTTIGNWRYEVFITQLPNKGWPAADVVTAYYGRVGQENRFAQEDREVNLDRLFSHSLPGQIFATWTGLFVWNLKTLMGFKMTQSKLTGATQDLQRSSVKQPGPREAGLDKRLLEALELIPWEGILGNKIRKDWKWETGKGLCCPAGNLIPLKRVDRKMSKIYFQAKLGTCGNCDMRSSCSKSTQQAFCREFTFQIDRPLAKEIIALKRQRLPSINPGPSAFYFKDIKTPATWSEPFATESGPFSIAGPFLVPSELRHKAKDFDLLFEVKVTGSNTPPIPRNPFIAKTAARRQRRRLTWAERLNWNAANGSFCISFAGQFPGHFDQLLKVLVGKCEEVV